MKKAVWFSVGLVSVIAITAVGGWYWWQGQQAPEARSSSGGSVSLGETVDAPANNEQALEMSGQTLTQSAGSGGSSGTGGSGGSNGSSTAPSETPASATLPGPAQFGQYEQYKQAESPLFIDIEAGTGKAVGAGSVVTVDYRGWLTDGKLFDESYSRNEKFSFRVGDHRVISGWEMGTMGMKEGGKRRLIIPPAFGYKNQAQGDIPANSVLIFDIWVHEVK
jgi:hypothetical protein